MHQVTLAELRSRVVDASDIGPVSATSYITTARVNDYINQSARAFLDLLYDAHGEDYIESVSPHTFNTVVGTEAYALPADFYRATLVSATIDGVTSPLRRAMNRDLERYRSDIYRVHRGLFPMYQIGMRNLVLVPVPSQVYSVKLRYIPTTVGFNASSTPISALSLDTDYVDAVHGWDDWIVYDACIRIAIQEDRDPSSYAAFREGAERRIRTASDDRSGGPDRVQRVFSAQDDWV